jgi:hypothetical protein
LSLSFASLPAITTVRQGSLRKVHCGFLAASIHLRKVDPRCGEAHENATFFLLTAGKNESDSSTEMLKIGGTN